MKVAKKVLALLLTVVMLCSLANAAMAMDVYKGFCGESATWAIDSNGTLTISGSGDIKAYSGGSHSDFRQYKSKIKKAIVKRSIMSIGAYAFQGMSALTTVKMDDSVVKIGASAFADCPVLTTVTLSSNIVSIGSYAFSNCSALKSIVIPNLVTTINAHVFDGCTGLKTIEIQNASCKFASSAILPQGVTVIGYQNSTAQEYAQKNGLAFQVIGNATPEQPTQPTSDTASTTQTSGCPLCGQTHEGFPGSLIGGIHSFIYGLLMLFGLRTAA